ncbi:DUF4358 domain-containing protein [Paenibacillus sp. MMS18-CY102]|uniref:DUF4358 domain-containing protein n=1 Tax=Paenibacillus sp. MMS18-CY102 TaxID=2682849 RepID=UPI00136570B0|nr:DUF4358 domain-containing protein [Paenibacillus sp. MMS18-CY102]MWC27896.1 DUF4358 domain-containing protein [Paenibacillus sp. MMS18-CY102]
MKKWHFPIVIAVILAIALSACSSSSDKGRTEPQLETTKTAQEMTTDMLTKVESPRLIPLEGDMVKDMYHLDPALLDQYSILTPMINLKTDEIAVLKVKDAKDLPTIEAAVKQRAVDIQKTFEHYLPDQYENAKNYKLVTKGNYILFVISDAEPSGKLEAAFNSYFTAK